MIRILCIGKNKDKALVSLEKEYLKRLSAFDKVQLEEVKDEPNTLTDRPAEAAKVKETEGKRVLDRIKPNEFVVLLDLHGTMPDSETFAASLQTWHDRAPVTFVIAGSLGPSPQLINRANYRLKLSDLTFTHLMTRVLLLEQTYRAFMINAGRSYHK